MIVEQGVEKPGGEFHGALGGELGDSDPLESRDAPNAPHVKTLRAETKRLSQNVSAYCGNETAMVMSVHDDCIHATWSSGKGSSLMEKHGHREPTEFMKKLAERIRGRIEKIGGKQSDIARAAKLSPQRFGNYVQGTRTPDIEALARIARALNVSTDWLLGLSESGPVEIYPIVQSLLELEGLAPARASAIASVVQEALRILAALPDEGDVAVRSRLAALAAWQSRLGPTPTQ